MILLAPSRTLSPLNNVPDASQAPLFASLLPTVEEALDKALSNTTPQTFFKVSDTIAKKLIALHANRDAYPRKEAIFLFSGLVFKCLDASSLSEKALDFAENHLRIASGLYGLLRPKDGIYPYRLDWIDPLKIDNQKLGAWWAEQLRDTLRREDLIISLASKEYEEPLLKVSEKSFHRVRFLERQPDGSTKNKATLAKMARGSLARLMLEGQIHDIDTMRTLVPMNFHYHAQLSNEHESVFICEKGSCN